MARTLLKEMRGRNPDLKIILSRVTRKTRSKEPAGKSAIRVPAKAFTLSQLVAAVKETMTPS